MALRVLLADESATIKKVMQISLQDFAVEVRSVQLGVDVLSVAQQFKPDIIFADILLQKKNGYEVSAELKKNPATKDIPVILMWSGFMEADAAKMKASLANGSLEKPFDAETLRQMIDDLVPKTKQHGISQFMEFPDAPKQDGTQTKSSTSAKRPPPAPEPPKKEVEIIANDEGSSWNMDNFENMSLSDFGKNSEEFKQVPLSALTEETATGTSTSTGTNTKTRTDFEPGEEVDLSIYSSHDEDEWVQKDLSAFKVDLPENEDDDAIALEFDTPLHDEKDGDDSDDIEALINTKTKTMVRIADRSDKTQVLEKHSGDRTVRAEIADVKAGVRKKTPAPTGTRAGASPEEIERIVREQTQEIVEKIVKKLVPDIASQLIKEEIRRLLDDSP